LLEKKKEEELSSNLKVLSIKEAQRLLVKSTLTSIFAEKQKQ
jgi:hypothetical protein